MKFTLQHKDPSSQARAGELQTDHGVVKTPIFMPVGTAAKESGEFYKVSEIESSLFNYVPRTYTIYYRRGSRRLKFGVRTRTTGNPLEMGGREYFIGPTGKREQIVKDLDTLMKEVKKYARFDKVLVQTINGEPVKK